MFEIAEIPTVLLSLGGMFLLGLLADIAGRHTPLPRVTLLLLAGILIGPYGLALLPEVFLERWFPLLTHIALALVGFMLGREITYYALRENGRAVLWLTAGKVAGATITVAILLFAIGVEPAAVLLLAGIAAATAPAAMLDVVKEMKIKGRFTDILLGIVAIDDALGLLIFSFLLAAVGAVNGDGGATGAILSGLTEISGSILLGLLMGLPLVFTDQIRSGESTQAKVLGMILLSTGISIWLDLSPILVAITMGSTVASLARHYKRPFKRLDDIEWPVLLLFFLLAGASLEVGKLLAVGWIGAAYIIARMVGSYGGASIGARLGGSEPAIQRWMGLCLFPQAGVALGMALFAAQRFPEIKDIILPVVIGSTIMFEVIGPVITRRVLRHVKAIEPGLVKDAKKH